MVHSSFIVFYRVIAFQQTQTVSLTACNFSLYYNLQLHCSCVAILILYRPGNGVSAGQCVCDAAVGFTGPSCDRAPGCSDTNPTCTGNGICDSSSGTCACSQKTYQTNPLCPDYECPVPGGKISKRRRSNVAVIIIVSLY